MATGALDANGVWQYGEDDSEATFSALLNKLGSSVSTQIGARKVLQVVSNTYSTSVTTSVALPTYVTTGLTATITPRSSSSKILIMTVGTYYNSAAGRSLNRLFRGTVAGTALNAYTNYYTTPSDGMSAQSLIFLDSPGTTSATTYTLGFATSGGGFVVNAQWSSSPSQMILIEVAG
jgi:hypothetical protein